MARVAKSLRIFYNDVYTMPLPAKHRFPMEKYRACRELLQATLSGRSDVEFCVSPVATQTEISTTHCPQYVRRFFEGDMSPAESMRVGFPWSEAGVRRAASSVGGTVQAMRSVCEGHVLKAAHVAGGTHHAFYDYGEGFCIFSDIAVAATLALKEYPSLIQQILIVDLDVHQGNGNAVLFQDNPSVFTFSMHCSGNYFSAVQQSDLDVEVAPGAGDDEYLSTLAQCLPRLLDEVEPDLVFYQAGVDGFKDDRLGKLNLTQEGIKTRDSMVYEAIESTGAVPLVVTMGGGYPRDRDVTSSAFRSVAQTHANVYLTLAEHTNI